MLRHRVPGWRRAMALGLAAASIIAAADTGDRVDFKYMYYWDRNGVWNHTPALAFLKSLSDAWKFQWNQEFDAVSGASRRLGLRNVGREGDHHLVLDGITGASRREIRHSEQASLAYADRGRAASASLYYSDENDYTSYSPAVAGSWDFNERNTTLGGSAALFLDHLHPQGAFEGLGGSRRIASVTVTAAQILSRTTLAALTANVIHSSGVLGHPYNPVVLAQGALLVEHLPSRKTSYALSGQLIQGYRLADRRGSLHLEGRYYQDSWKLASRTADIQLYQYLSGDTYLRLRARGYAQGAAAFARDAYAGDELYRSSDIRFYRFASLTLGAKLASTFPDGWAESGFLPDRWDLSYDHGVRDTHGEEGGPGPFSRYQLFPKDQNYMQGTFMAGLSFDL